MRRAKKTKMDVTQTADIIKERIAAAEGGQAAENAPLLLHTGVAAAPAPADKLQEQLETALFVVSEAIINPLSGGPPVLSLQLHYWYATTL